MHNSPEKSGKVYLVGAGPGDPGLITLRGCACLAAADLVLYDYLVNPQLLEHTRADAQRVCLGRHGQDRIVPQEEINQRMVTEARQGRIVVRLKGGDPAVFARGADEAETLSEAGIAFEIVPGITAALAAGSYAGIPVTHRELASSVVLVTGQETTDKPDSGVDFDALAKMPGTIVVYMGVTTALRWSQALMDAGKSPQTPAAVIRRCSWPDQRLARCTLGEIPQVLAPGKMRPPVIVILGEVVNLHEKLDWFTRRPLFGRTVLLTRPLGQARAMRDQLARLGAGVLIQPAIEISDPPDWTPVDAALEHLGDFDWLVFSSANGVRRLLDRLAFIGRDLRQLGGVKIAAIGPATSEALAEYRLNTDLAPDEYRAEALAEALGPIASGKRFLLARASRGREVLAEQLSVAGAQVEQIVVYSSTDVAAPDAEIAAAMRGGAIDWTTATSSAIARSLVNLFGDALASTQLASISPLTSGVLRELGHKAAVEATAYTTDGLIDAILQSVSDEG